MVAKSAVTPAQIDTVTTAVDNLTASPVADAIAPVIAAKIPPKIRRIIYVAGIFLGAIAMVGGSVSGVLTGNTGAITASIAGLAYSLSSLLAMLHTNVPA